MTGEMQDDNWLARRWTLILAMAVRFAGSPQSLRAISSISMRAPRGREATPMVVRAG